MKSKPPKTRKRPRKPKLPTIGDIKAKADRALQDSFRRNNPGKKCEMCLVNDFQVMHHFIWKSQSNFLRYDEKDLIFVCNPCHSKFHAFPDPTYPIKVAVMRGPEWVEYIEKNKHKLKSDNRIEIMGIIEKYSPTD